jgi:hypothetical protein
MKRTAIALSLALAFATPAFAQYNAPAAPAAPASDQAAPADDSQSMNSDAPKPMSKAKAKHHQKWNRKQFKPYKPYNSTAAAMTGNEPKSVAYQYSNRMKSYPAVDHGHVAGDPPVIDHSGDQAPVTPTHTTINVPPVH